MDTGLLEKSPAGGPVDQRAIFDRRRVSARIEAALGECTAGTVRGAVLAVVKEALDAGRAEVRRRFEAGGGGPAAARATCFLVDQAIRVLYDHVAGRLYPLGSASTGERLSLVALGGYGRGELAPFSDVDLLFLLPYKLTPRSEQVVESLLYSLWDLGFKVGNATRSIDECIRLARGDHVICTSLLEARYLWGDQELVEDLRQRFRREVEAVGKARFIEAKLAERAERHKRLGASRYSLEPNIKEGKGGLRDLHTLFWIAKYVYEVDDIAVLEGRGIFTKSEVRLFEKAHNFLWTLRFRLHYTTGRAEERLTFDQQKAIAPLMGYTAHAGTQDVERFMKHYFLVAKDVGDLTRIFCAALEAQHNRRSRFRLPLLTRKRTIEGFRREGDRLTVKDKDIFDDKPIEMLRIFRVAQKHELDIHPEALRWVTQGLRHIGRGLREDPAANKLFLDMLTASQNPEVTLRRLNEAGVFGRFVPDFGRVVAQMQYNMYHHYTVDEHTIFAIGILHKIEQGKLKDEVPISSEVVHKLLSRRVLYVALLLHDIAKGRQGDHSEVGAKIARKLCPRLGLSEEETETVAWLVLHHLKMSNTAFKRDIEDPKTIADFCALVQSLERLRLLLVLTVADIRAVGPGTWNAWKAALLRDLYWRTEEVLSGGLVTEGREARVHQAKQALADALPDWPAAEVDAHLARGYPSYWLSADIETHLRHARLVRHAEASHAPLTVDRRVDSYRGVTEITVYAADHPGLFSRIAGALAVSGATIDAARIFTLANGMALDSFFVRDAAGGPFDRPDKLARMASAIEKTLSGSLKPMLELAKRRLAVPSRLEVFKVPPRVLIDNKASARDTVIEVNGRDRVGLLHELTQALTRLNLIIHSARIATFGESAVDVFYVQDPLGAKVEQPAKLKRIQQRLAEVLEGREAVTKAPVSSEERAATAKPPEVGTPAMKTGFSKPRPTKPSATMKARAPEAEAPKGRARRAAKPGGPPRRATATRRMPKSRHDPPPR
ncbi:MAG: [protein-PII] uridylyltransferase [Kiloniellales bacterium]